MTIHLPCALQAKNWLSLQTESSAVACLTNALWCSGIKSLTSIRNTSCSRRLCKNSRILLSEEDSQHNRRVWYVHWAVLGEAQKAQLSWHTGTHRAVKAAKSCAEHWNCRAGGVSATSLCAVPQHCHSHQVCLTVQQVGRNGCCFFLPCPSPVHLRHVE